MPIKLESFGITHTGYVRSNNEDVFATLGEKKFYILADGMGGHRAGEVAASYALHSMCASISALGSPHSVDEACQTLRQAMLKANTEVFNAAQEHTEYAGMGTTLCCFLILGSYLIYGHIGDSRLYRYRNQLEQLTLDHSLRNTTPLKKEPSPELLRNVITRSIGNQPTILPDIGIIPLQPNDLYMLCSDGLSDYVPEAKTAKIVSSRLSLEQMSLKLLNAALEEGGQDNITVVLVRCANE